MGALIYRLTAELFKALAHPARVEILDFLRNGEQCVCHIIARLEMEQSNVSQHLAVLKKQSLVTSRKDGMKVMYRISHPEVVDLIDQTARLLERQLTETAEALRHLQERNQP
ncbi:MAG: ArsR/SmtB family transcription factor [Bacillota bacterium]